METFSALLAICAGNSPANGEIPAQRPVTRSFDVYFDLRLDIRLSKQYWRHLTHYDVIVICDDCVAYRRASLIVGGKMLDFFQRRNDGNDRCLCYVIYTWTVSIDPF